MSALRIIPVIQIILFHFLSISKTIQKIIPFFIHSSFKHTPMMLGIIVIIFEGKSFDQYNMTEWMWPKNLNMTKKITPTNINLLNMTEIVWQRRTWTVEYDQNQKIKLFRSYSTGQVCRPNEFKALWNFGNFHGYFGHVQPFMFIGVIFWSSSIVHVCRCDVFSVIF